jgi:hypothetical protein
MECCRCGLWAPPDPTTGYDADQLCPECQAIEDGIEVMEFEGGGTDDTRAGELDED